MDNHRSITKSKIVCTLGPASNSPEKIKALSDIGMDCTRINFSHGNKEDKIELFNRIREVDGTLAILCDIQGPKIRIGMVKDGGVMLQAGNTIVVTSEDIIGDQNRVTISHLPLPQEIKIGELIYINDGIVCLKAIEVIGNEVTCDILAGGMISSRKGVNLPTTEISLSVPTEKDMEDLELIADLDPEFVAISFVESGKDVENIREILSSYGNDNIKLISKIERPIALENFDRILKVSDGIMVARGDLGVEIAPRDVVPAQKMIINKCNIEGKPVIVATQMLESMVVNPVATRAEVSDVFNTINDGADAVMLSAETASGNYPEKAVTLMEDIIRTSESIMKQRDPDDFDSDHEAIPEIIGHLVFSACKEFTDIAYQKGKVICLTESGYAARMISKYRPSLPILGCSSNQRAVREMRLQWGVEPVFIPSLDEEEVTKMGHIKLAAKTCYANNFVEPRENVIVSGNFFDFKAHGNFVSICSIEELIN